MDKIQKALRKINEKERETVRQILVQLRTNRLEGLDIKKLKGRNDIFRIRKGSIRILYRVDAARNIFLIAIERRSDTTYNLP